MAGISTAPLSTHHSVNVVQAPDGTGTALAMVNPSTVTAQLRWELRSPTGQVLATTRRQLASMNQEAFFFHELFPEMDLSDFSGGLILFSDTDVALMSLSTHNGIQQASLESSRPGK